MVSLYTIFLLGSLTSLPNVLAYTVPSPAHEADCTTIINCKTTSTVTTTEPVLPPVTITDTVTTTEPVVPPVTVTDTVTTTEPVVPPVTITAITTITPTGCPSCTPCPPCATPTSSTATETGVTPLRTCSTPVQNWTPFRLEWTADFPKPGNPESFIMTSSFDYPTILTITGDNRLYEQFTVYLGQTLLGKTSDISTVPSLGQDDCGIDANECLKKGWSHGTFNIPEGEQLILLTWENAGLRPDLQQTWPHGSGQYRFDRPVPCPQENDDERNQEKIKAMGKCDQGYPWKKIPGGYVCEGGGHNVSDEELANFSI